MKIRNDYDAYIFMDTEHIERTYTAVNMVTLKRFKQVFGECLVDVFQDTTKKKLDDNLSPKEIDRLNLIFKFYGDVYVEMSPSEYLTLNRIKC